MRQVRVSDFLIAPTGQAPAGFPRNAERTGASGPAAAHSRGPVAPACYRGNPNAVGAASPKPSSNRQMGMFAFSRVVNPQIRTVSSPSNVKLLIRAPHCGSLLHPPPAPFMTKQDEKPAKKARASEDAPAAAPKAQAKTEGGQIWLNLVHKWSLAGAFPRDGRAGRGEAPGRKPWSLAAAGWHAPLTGASPRPHTTQAG